MLTNLMAMIAKRDNATRTVAIAATAYRLLMSLDNEDIAEFESTSAYEHDSAKSGASALTAAEDRALLAETAHLDGNLTSPFTGTSSAPGAPGWNLECTSLEYGFNNY